MKYEDVFSVIVRNLRRVGIVPPTPLVKDRAIEYGFMAKELDFRKGQRILDVGHLESPVSIMLAGFGAKMFGIDLRECSIRCPGVISLVGDIRKTDFKDGYFDRIVSISTIEHLGIETRYGSYADINADRKALLEMKRILNDNGKIILTVPFGKAGINSVQRTYDLRGIKKLTRGFKILKMEFAKDFGGNWSYASIDEVKGTVGYHANVLVSLSK